WEVLKRRLERLPESDVATSVTRDTWVVPFLSLLGYELRYNPRAYEVDGLTFAISHRAGEAEDAPPVHIVSARQELGRLAPTGRPRLAPHSLVQEYLNRTEHLWGLVTNGLTLRLLRDSTYVRRQAYVEFDLQQIFEEQRFSDFAVLYRLLHRTRLPRSAADARDCWLEQYYQHAVEQGGRVRDRLRDGVEECIKRLANGFLAHPANQDLRQRVSSDYSEPNRLRADDFYRQLLRLVYRFLFLLVSEDRGHISADPLYREHYGVGRLRRLLDRREAYTEHDDLWCSLRVLWKVLSDERLAGLLGAAPLNGELFAPLALDHCTITNRDFLEAFWHLAYYRESPSAPPRRVNYAALDVEELGSVYESLLEYHPQIDASGTAPRFELALGSERKSTGSYYTPPELVAELIRSALEPVIEERLKAVRGRREEERALQEREILSIRVIDPACGSGHFLLAAARRLGKELARIRTGEDEPVPERVREAIRDVVAHCIYGVDKNPLAVELCKVALWLEAHCAGKPLTFLDHRIRCGDSLVGVFDLGVLERGIPDKAFDPISTDAKEAAGLLKKRNRSERCALESGQLRLPLVPARVVDALGAGHHDIEAIADDSPTAVREKKSRYDRLLADPERLRVAEACDLWTAAFFQRFTPGLATSPAAITTDNVTDRLADRAHPQALAAARALAVAHRFFHWPLEFPEVFADGGFDVVLGNPPFMGGLKISGHLGDKYRRWLEIAYAPYGGTADLCAAFYRRAFSLLKPGGRMGMVATNTIGQGDTRESGLAVILKQGGVITFARRFLKWPGAANVEVNLVAIQKPHHSPFTIRHSPILDGHPVPFISSRLDPEPEGEPKRLPQNEGKAFIGDTVVGIGFVIEPQEAEALLRKDARNADCLFPYLNGEDLNSHPEQKPSRYVICFHDWDLERAQQYPDLLRIVEERVKPQRSSLPPHNATNRKRRECWWQFGIYAQNMRRAIAPLRRVLVRAEVSQLHMVSFVPKDWVYSHMLIVFAFDDDYHFALLQSSVHEVWLRKQASSLRTDIRYTPTDCFDTFPFPPEEYERMANSEWRVEEMPEAFQRAAQVGVEYHEHRRQIMFARSLGLTKTYNLFHDPDCTDADIVRLRKLHAEMDRAVLACYGWLDVDLRHDFYPNDRGQIRFAVSPEARRELLRRLLELNERIFSLQSKNLRG
ncbi:MAG: N-6 DNA methylase, partial [Chloroflexi bacterium]|nr:N-6 DNA methylase [Chloroflexota bacterium]